MPRLRALLALLLVALALSPAASAGWPLAPTDRPHGVYGTFLNPSVAYKPERVLYRGQVVQTHHLRLSGRTSTGDFGGYHVAIDLAVNDAAPILTRRRGRRIPSTPGRPST